MDLHELAPVGGRPAGGRDRRRFERFAEVGEDLPDRTWLRDEGDEPDVAAAIAGRVPGLGVPAGRGIPLLADVPDGERGDGRPQRVVWREDAVIAMPVPPRLRNEIRKPGIGTETA
jgi:hypothetical protein